MGKILIVFGILVIIIGILITYSGKIPFFGRLPGDITIKRENFTFHFPLVTSIILSILLTLILYLVNKFR